ncbi:uncharacterized protein LOC143298665 [Babylonia areolata]|uniref:uncharacterized protein LOC143298665 n=1 Tax=Babylonia areolata TaxID=304850 RepID=UPI003FD0135E
MGVTAPGVPLLLKVVVALCVLCTCCTAVAPDNNDTCSTVSSSPNTTLATGGLGKVLNRGQAALLLLLGFGGFSVLLALLYISIRRYVFKDADNLNTTFDAGGKVSMSLTAVTVASQLMWPGDLLQPTTVTIKNGVAGPFWYSTAAVMNMILFPVLSVQFKTRAPGAKTFLQVIYGRFGKPAHIVACCFALLLNLVVVICLVSASVVLLQSLIQDASEEFCVLIMATLFGSYSFVGGLGSTFYVSYFNAAMIYVVLAVFIVQVFYKPEGEVNGGGFSGMYHRLKCLEGPEGNQERSYLTFWSEGAVIWAVQGSFATASITFCDQASWQSRIAAKPTQGVLGFFAATYIWFAVPSTIGTSLGFAYLDFQAQNATRALSEGDVDAGLVTAFMAQEWLGVTGSYMVLTMLIMSLMSSGSGEVMAVSSIIVYDLYQTHLRPFRKNLTTAHCLLCGLTKPKEVTSSDKVTPDLCQCTPFAECRKCHADEERLRNNPGPSGQKTYRCDMHGEFHMYQNSLMSLKSWVILWVTLALVPLGLLVTASGMDLNWIMMCGFILTIPCFPGALMTIIWVKTTSLAFIVGGLCGLAGGVTANLIMASTYEGGLSNFLPNTSQNYAVLAGSCSAFGLSLLLTFVISLFTHNIRSPDDEKAEWQKLREIDNPLHPWAETFQEDFPQLKPGSQPSYDELDKVFRKAKLVAYVGGAVSLLLFICIIPGIMLAMHELSEAQFTGWVTGLQAWCFLVAAVVLVVVPVEETITIIRQIHRNRRKEEEEGEGAKGKGGEGVEGGGGGGEDGEGGGLLYARSAAGPLNHGPTQECGGNQAARRENEILGFLCRNIETRRKETKKYTYMALVRPLSSA